MNKWIRQLHRWLSIAFTVTVIANFVALARGTPPAWVTYSPLPPLALLLFTGLYLFICRMPPSGAAEAQHVGPSALEDELWRRN